MGQLRIVSGLPFRNGRPWPDITPPVLPEPAEGLAAGPPSASRCAPPSVCWDLPPGHTSGSYAPRAIRLAEVQARLEESELRARLAWETAEILRARFAKLPERHRPYFTPAQRFRILEMRSLLAWSAQEAARVFLVCPNTILLGDGR